MTSQPENHPEGLPEPLPFRAPKPMLLTIGMVLGSLMMWAGAPVFWVWLAGRIATWTTGETRITGSLALLILGGIIVSAAVLAKLLGVMNRRHMELTGLVTDKRHARSWNKSMRDSSRNHERGLLEPILYWSLGLAAIAATIFSAIYFDYVGPG